MMSLEPWPLNLRSGYDVSIVSNDKICSLVNDKINIYNPIKDIRMKPRIMKSMGLAQKRSSTCWLSVGICLITSRAYQVLERRPQKLLNSYGTWQGVIDNIPNIAKMQQKVQDAAEDLPLYADLVKFALIWI